MGMKLVSAWLTKRMVAKLAGETISGKAFKLNLLKLVRFQLDLVLWVLRHFFANLSRHSSINLRTNSAGVIPVFLLRAFNFFRCWSVKWMLVRFIVCLSYAPLIYKSTSILHNSSLLFLFRGVQIWNTIRTSSQMWSTRLTSAIFAPFRGRRAWVL